MTSPIGDPAHPPIILAARNLTLALGQGSGAVAILKGIDLAVPQGQTLALLGPSGSGKSSLMAVLTGLERASSGTLAVAGADFIGLDEDALARARRGRIGIVLQAFHLLPTMTALENVMTALELAGIPDAQAIAAEELKAVGLGHRLAHYPAQLSGGEQQRVAIARALAGATAAAVRRRAHRQSRCRHRTSHRRTAVRAPRRNRGDAGDHHSRRRAGRTL